MSRVMEFLKRGYAELCQEATAETKRCKQAVVRDRHRRTRAWTETLRLLSVVCLLTDARRHPMAVAWDMQQQKYAKLWGTLTLADEDLREYIIAQLEAEEYPPEEATFLFHPESVTHIALWFRAWMIVVEWRLAVDTISANTDKHVAVPAQPLHIQVEKFILDETFDMPPGVRALALAWVHERTQNAKTVWLCRWRKTWGFTVRVLPSRSLVLDADMRTKVNKRANYSSTIPATPTEVRNGHAKTQICTTVL